MSLGMSIATALGFGGWHDCIKAGMDQAQALPPRYIIWLASFVFT